MLPGELREIIFNLRNANYRVSNKTDHDQRTVSSHMANKLVSTGYVEFVRDEVTKDFRSHGSVRRYLVINERGRQFVDGHDLYRPREDQCVVWKHQQERLNSTKAYRNADKGSQGRIVSLMRDYISGDGNLETFVDVLRQFNSAKEFIEYMTDKPYQTYERAE
jgi:hypothetical protein